MLRNFKDDFPKKPLMILSPSIRAWFERPIRWVKTIFSLQHILIFLLVLLFSAFAAVMFSKNLCWISPYLGLTEKNKILTFLGIGMGGILLALQAVIANRRARALENDARAQADAANAQADATKEQAKANEKTESGQRQERFKNAIEHLGHQSVSVRLGGAYELFHLAKDTAHEAKDLRQTILDILCAHIRQTTREKEYQQKHPGEPSEEVQSLLTLMFVEEHEVFKDCRINLQGSWLNGAKLPQARLQGANLVEVFLQDAKLREAKLQGANLRGAFLLRVKLDSAHLHGARFGKAHLQGAFLERASLHGADLGGAEMQVAYLHRAQLQGASLEETRLQGAVLTGAQLQGTNLWQTRLQGAELNRACLQGIYSEDTIRSFAKRIKGQIGRDSESGIAMFAGGVSREEVDSLVEGLPDENRKTILRHRLAPHIGREESREIPKESHAVPGAYTEEEAEQWIAEYEEAMSEVSKADNKQ